MTSSIHDRLYTKPWGENSPALRAVYVIHPETPLGRFVGMIHKEDRGYDWFTGSTSWQHADSFEEALNAIERQDLIYR